MLVEIVDGIYALLVVEGVDIDAAEILDEWAAINRKTVLVEDRFNLPAEPVSGWSEDLDESDDEL